MASVRKSLVLSFAQKYSTMAIAIASTMILARLLTPAEIGVFSVGAAVVNMAHLLRDFGVGSYLVQEKELTRDRIRTAFGVTMAIAWALAGILFLASGPLAQFYREPGIQEVLVVLCINFLILPFSSPVLALLGREMAFGALYVIGLSSALSHAVASVALAYLGFGFMSLAWGSIAGVAVTAAVASIYRPGTAWVLPGFSEWRRVLSFGSRASGISLISELAARTPELTIGRTLGFDAVGMYSRAEGFALFFTRGLFSVVGLVLLPAFANKSRAGEEILPLYLKSVSYITGVSWPLFAFLGLMAQPIVRVMFGDQWDAAVPLAQWMCLNAIVMGLCPVVPQTFMGIGQINEYFKIEIIFQPFKIVVLLVAAFFGLKIVTIVYVMTSVVYFIFTFFRLKPVVGITSSDLFHAARPSLFVTACSVLGPVIVFLLMDMGPGNTSLPLVTASVLVSVGWLIGVFVFKHPVKDEFSIALQSLANVSARLPWNRKS